MSNTQYQSNISIYLIDMNLRLKRPPRSWIYKNTSHWIFVSHCIHIYIYRSYDPGKGWFESQQVWISRSLYEMEHLSVLVAATPQKKVKSSGDLQRWKVIENDLFRQTFPTSESYFPTTNFHMSAALLKTSETGGGGFHAEVYEPLGIISIWYMVNQPSIYVDLWWFNWI